MRRKEEKFKIYCRRHLEKIKKEYKFINRWRKVKEL